MDALFEGIFAGIFGMDFVIGISLCSYVMWYESVIVVENLANHEPSRAAEEHPCY